MSDLFQDLHQRAYSPAALTFWLLPSIINLHHLDGSRLCVASELHGPQVAAGGDCRQHALRQTLGLLHGAATTGPVGLPGVSFMTVTATLKSSWHGSCTATASLFGSSAGAEGAAVKRPAVTPELPLHAQNKRRALDMLSFDTNPH